jgi:glycine cleavage system aminomethyltransferase T
MTQYCRDSGGLFNDFVFSQSDEAFLLLVLLNYTETWMSEFTHEQSKVRLI